MEHAKKSFAFFSKNIRAFLRKKKSHKKVYTRAGLSNQTIPGLPSVGCMGQPRLTMGLPRNSLRDAGSLHRHPAPPPVSAELISLPVVDAAPPGRCPRHAPLLPWI
jgi:hypothetical protein